MRRSLVALLWIFGCSSGTSRSSSPPAPPPPPNTGFTEDLTALIGDQCVAASELTVTTGAQEIVAALLGDTGASRGLQRVHSRAPGIAVAERALDAVATALADPRLATSGFAIQGPRAVAFRDALIIRGVAASRLKATSCPGTADRVELVRRDRAFDQAAAEAIARAAYAVIQQNQCGALRELAIGALEWRTFGLRGDELREAVQRIDLAIADCRDWAAISRDLAPARVAFEHTTAKAGGRVEDRPTRADVDGYVVDLVADHKNRPWRFRAFVVQIGETRPGLSGIDLPGSSCWMLGALCDEGAGPESVCNRFDNRRFCDQAVNSICRGVSRDIDGNPITRSTQAVELCTAWVKSR